MPKIVDHDQRRQQITSQVIANAAALGTAGLTMRSVASAMGLSQGALQHYFPTVDAMLDAAVAEVGRRREARVRAQLDALGHAPRERDVLLASAFAGVPADAERREECLAEVAFLGRGVGASSTIGEGVGALVALFEELLRRAERRGALAVGVRPEVEARILWAIVASQAQGILTGVTTPTRVEETLRYWADRVLPIEGCHAPDRSPTPTMEP